jgi:hypothetical protein
MLLDTTLRAVAVVAVLDLYVYRASDHVCRTFTPHGIRAKVERISYASKNNTAAQFTIECLIKPAAALETERKQQKDISDMYSFIRVRKTHSP